MNLETRLRQRWQRTHSTQTGSRILPHNFVLSENMQKVFPVAAFHRLQSPQSNRAGNEQIISYSMPL